MQPSHHVLLAATLRPLEHARASLAELAADPTGAAGPEHFARAVEGVEAALRRWLRDDGGAALPVRLSALAPDEIPVDRLIGELRQRNRVSVELAAGFHELWVRTRSPRSAPALDPRDVEALRAVVARTEQEISAAPLPAPGTSDIATRDHEPAHIHAVPPEGRTGALPVAPWAFLFAVVVALLLAVALWWTLWNQRPVSPVPENRGRAVEVSRLPGPVANQQHVLPFATPFKWT